MEKARRSFFKIGAAVLGFQAISSLLGKGAKAHVEDEGGGLQPQPVAYPPLIVSHRVSEIPLEPDSPEWEKNAAPLRIPLSPQLIVKPRLYEPSVTEILVRSLYNDTHVGFLMEWQENTQSQNIGIGKTVAFRDAVAFSFPANITKPIPYFGMGHVENEVIIYQWKSDWEFGIDYDLENEFKGMHVDFYPFSGRNPGQIAQGIDYGKEEKAEWESNPRVKAFNTAWAAGNILADPQAKKRAPVEKLVASGFGNLTTESNQDCTARGKWGKGWHVVILFPRKQDRYTFTVGVTYPVNFAVWDGHNGERGAEKSISTWSSFALEKRAGWPPITAAVIAAAAVGALEWIILKRRRSTTSPTREGK